MFEKRNRTTGTTRNNKGIHGLAMLCALFILTMATGLLPQFAVRVCAATTYTEKGELILSASKKKGEVYTDKGFPVSVVGAIEYNEDFPDDIYYFTAKAKGTLTIDYSFKSNFKQDAHGR